MERIKRFFIESWLAKLVSLGIAFSIWYLIKTNLETKYDFPVPGTSPTSSSRTPGGPGLDDPILGPLLPSPPLTAPAPLAIPVPGGAGQGQGRSSTLP